MTLSIGAAVEPAATSGEARMPLAESAALDSADGQPADWITAFGLDLYEKLQDENEGNLFFSPLSISTALAMVYAGARGDTADQMAEVLHFPANDTRFHSTSGSLIDQLNAAGGDSFELAVANALWGQEGYRFLADYLSLVEEAYSGGLRDVNFAGDPQAVADTINSWADEATRGCIDEVLKPDQIDAAIRLILTNAVYFKGQWIHSFDTERTTPRRRRASRRPSRPGNRFPCCPRLKSLRPSRYPAPPPGSSRYCWDSTQSTRPLWTPVACRRNSYQSDS